VIAKVLAWLKGCRDPAGLSRGWLAGWLGDAGERAAARHLRRAGLRILARRYRTPLGELDLVAREGECIVFVEVKTRRSCDAGLPFEAVDRRKQAQLTRLALAFLKRHGWLERPARFDVVSIIWPAGARNPEITHYRHAFEPVGRGQMFS
jgi:putative endonuclease